MKEKNGSNKKGEAGRPRSEAVRRAVLTATLALATEQPYSSVTIEGIAARAGVGKQTLYRWWPTKAAIILEALTETAKTQIAPPHTDDPCMDLKEFLAATFRVLNTPTGKVVRLLLAEAQTDATFAEPFRNLLILPRREALLSILYRLAPLSQGELLADFIFGAMWYRLLVGHAPLDEAFAAQIAETLLCQPQERLDFVN